MTPRVRRTSRLGPRYQSPWSISPKTNIWISLCLLQLHEINMYHQCEHRRAQEKNSRTPSSYQDVLCRETDRYPHRPCHFYQATPSPTGNYTLQDESEIEDIKHHGYGDHPISMHKENVHCYLGTRSCIQQTDPRMNGINTRNSACTHHRKTCPYFRHEITCTHTQIEPQFHDRTEGENHIEHSHHSRVERRPTPEQNAGDRPKTHEHQPHQHASSIASRPFVRTKKRKSHEKRCEDNTRCVRFSAESDFIEHPSAHDPNCPVHGSQLPDSRRHGIYGNVPVISRKLRTYRWAWGPPLPVDGC